jgi:large subunit ribosomal protein L24
MKPNKKYKPALHNKNAIPDMWKITRGDDVIVNGEHLKSYGERGIVKAVLRDSGRVIVTGVNLGIRRIKANTQAGIKGGQVMMPRSLHYSNINLVDPVTGEATRISKKFMEDGRKVRVSKKSGAIIPRAESLKVRNRPKSLEVGPRDTNEAMAWERTYFGIGAKGNA